MNATMLALEFFRWWYGQGWTMALRDSNKRMRHLAESFSITILLRTLFAPWKRIISNPGAGIDAHVQATIDNMVSRCIGFVIRISVLVWVTILFFGNLIAGLLQFLLWPLLPPVAIALIAWGIF